MVEQMGFFEGGLVGPGLDVTLHRSLFSPDESDRLFRELLDFTPWQQDYITMFGKSSPIPRRTAWFGESSTPYTYSGITMRAHDWNDSSMPVNHTLSLCRKSVDAVAETRFNSLLLNRYDSGKDGVAWHADDEPELGPEPTIGSVTFGATRRFQLRRRDRADEKREIELHAGDVLIMRGSTQRDWLHQIPKTSRSVGTRINLTFRVINPDE